MARIDHVGIGRSDVDLDLMEVAQNVRDQCHRGQAGALRASCAIRTI